MEEWKNVTIRQFDNSTMEEWKNGRVGEWKSGKNVTIRPPIAIGVKIRQLKNGKMEEMEFFTSRVALCALLFALCAMRNKRIMDKV